jgi:hypothetical protein
MPTTHAEREAHLSNPQAGVIQAPRCAGENASTSPRLATRYWFRAEKLM